MKRPCIVAEKIHATRSVRIADLPLGASGHPEIQFEWEGAGCRLEIPDAFLKGSEAARGRIRPVAVACYLLLHGGAHLREMAGGLIQSLAREQEQAGADYLDINTDQVAADTETRVKAMRCCVEAVLAVSRLPLSIDSSSVPVLTAGLAAAGGKGAAPMLNSASLERPEVFELAAGSGGAVVVSGGGGPGLPDSAEQTVANLEEARKRLSALGVPDPMLYLDPLVLPVASVPDSAKRFFECIRLIRERMSSEIHIIGGISNISFGMPDRTLINRLFYHFAREVGMDAVIADPAHILAEGMEITTDPEVYEAARLLFFEEDPFPWIEYSRRDT